jgi:hypothetical protein
VGHAPSVIERRQCCTEDAYTRETVLADAFAYRYVKFLSRGVVVDVGKVNVIAIHELGLFNC